MGYAFECDRCGGLSGDPPSLVIWSREHDGEPEIIDHPRAPNHGGDELCPDCHGSFDRFMENGSEGPR